MKNDLTVVTADKSKDEPHRRFSVKGPDQDTSHFPADNEIHQRHSVEIIPTPDFLLKFFQSLHL